ncbi:MAG: DUF2997 domain-containing protein [Thermoguttaceae bacterium]
MNQTICIIVSPEGKAKLETSGFTGVKCKEVAMFLVNALGKNIDEKLKPEYFEHETFTSTHNINSQDA